MLTLTLGTFVLVYKICLLQQRSRGGLVVSADQRLCRIALVIYNQFQSIFTFLASNVSFNNLLEHSFISFVCLRELILKINFMNFTVIFIVLIKIGFLLGHGFVF